MHTRPLDCHTVANCSAWVLPFLAWRSHADVQQPQLKQVQHQEEAVPCAEQAELVAAVLRREHGCQQ